MLEGARFETIGNKYLDPHLTKMCSFGQPCIMRVYVLIAQWRLAALCEYFTGGSSTAHGVPLCCCLQHYPCIAAFAPTGYEKHHRGHRWTGKWCTCIDRHFGCSVHCVARRCKLRCGTVGGKCSLHTYKASNTILSPALSLPFPPQCTILQRTQAMCVRLNFFAPPPRGGRFFHFII